MSSNIIAFFDSESRVVPINNEADKLRDAESKLAAAERRIAELEAKCARAITAAAAVSNKTTTAVSKPVSAIDQVVAHLSSVVKLAQGLSDQDQRRVRDFTHVASSLLMSTTYLVADDQHIFETALRDAVKR
jgi:hypothetical protein